MCIVIGDQSRLVELLEGVTFLCSFGYGLIVTSCMSFCWFKDLLRKEYNPLSNLLLSLLTLRGKHVIKLPLCA